MGKENEYNPAPSKQEMIAHIRKAVKGSLKRLRIEAIDLYCLHRVDQ